jgi:hypothetical protein
MMNRYYPGLGGAIPTFFFSNGGFVTSGPSLTVTTVIRGFPGSVVVVKLTTLTKSNSGGFYQLNGTNHVLNDTVSLTIGGTGTISFTQTLNVGTSTPGNAILTVLTIISTTLGIVGTPNLNQNSYTV